MYALPGGGARGGVQNKGGAVVLGRLLTLAEKNICGSVALWEYAAVVYCCASSLNKVSAPHSGCPLGRAERDPCTFFTVSLA